MTENEAIKVIGNKACNDRCKEIHCDDSCMYGKNQCAFEMAITALTEIQQYRAIGLTPTMVKDLISSEKKAHKVALENAHIVDEYEAIGTVEEFKTLKEKAEPKKVDENDCCPICHTYGKDDNGVAGDYCPDCGQALDWQ